MASSLTLLGPFKQLLTLHNLPLKGPLTDQQLRPLENAGILMADGIIVAVDRFDKLLSSHGGKAIVHFLKRPCVGLPGYIDCHTHIAFGGDRANDFALRNAGNTYLNTSKKGEVLATPCTKQEFFRWMNWPP